MRYVITVFQGKSMGNAVKKKKDVVFRLIFFVNRCILSGKRIIYVLQLIILQEEIL